MNCTAIELGADPPGTDRLGGEGAVCFFPALPAGVAAQPKDVALEIETLYRQFGPMVLRRCRQLLRDEDWAQDAMQDV
ncbi:MAG TPA: hypothetical protein PK208_17320, partial [Fibrobacteria bacterium]|nr:hypothetical protein [Fibrobacteria bacterium]